MISEPGKVAVTETEMPEVKEGEALLKLLYGGICGSDLGTYRGTFAYASYPRIPGHEFSAQIVEIGENDRGLKPGMIVTCNPYFNCQKCYSCEYKYLDKDGAPTCKNKLRPIIGFGCYRRKIYKNQGV